VYVFWFSLLWLSYWAGWLKVCPEMDAGSSRKFVNSYQTTLHHIPEDGKLHGFCHENTELPWIQLSSITDKWTGRQTDTVIKMMFFQNVTAHIQVSTKVSQEPAASTYHSLCKLRQRVLWNAGTHICTIRTNWMNYLLSIYFIN